MNLIWLLLFFLVVTIVNTLAALLPCCGFPVEFVVSPVSVLRVTL